jgi:opacity protein-like surface antigen
VALAASATWPHNQGMTFRLVLAAALLTLVPVATAAAAEHPQVRFTKAGQAAARAAGIIQDDVGRKANWHGGRFTPDPRSDNDCAGYHPKRADLVLNGLAGVSYEDSTNGISLRSQTAVFQTAKMVRLFEQRSLLAPKLLQCVAAQTAATLPKTLRFVTIERITFPSVGRFSTAWRITLELVATKEQVAIDQVAFTRGRTEVNLATTYFVANADTVRPAEARLAQAIAKRIRF